MISLAPISVEEMMAPRSKQRGVRTSTGRLIWLNSVWITQLQAVSGEGKYRRRIRSHNDDVRMQIKVRLMPKVGSLRTEDAAQEENVAGTSYLIENWRQDLSLLNEGVTKNEPTSGMIFGFLLRYNPDRFLSFNVHWKYFLYVYPLSFTNPTNLSRSPVPSYPTRP